MNIPVKNTVFPKENLSVVRTVAAFWLMGWFIKSYFFIPYIFGEVTHYPVLNGFFPEFLRNPLPLQFFYVFPAVSFLLIFRQSGFYHSLMVTSMIVSSAVLLLHQDTHNDATFLTSFWVAVWLWWFVSQMHRRDESFFIHARSLALCLIAFIFLGGFIGKLTPEYWDGTVFSNIYLSQEPTLINQWVRANFDEAGIRGIFAWIAKMVIIGEGFLVFAPVCPYSVVLVFGVVFMIGISLFTTWRIFSVLLCLIGLLIALRPSVPKKNVL